MPSGDHFIDNAHDHPLSSLKFVLIEEVSIKTEEFLGQREGCLASPVVDL